MLDVALVVLALEGLDILLKQALIEFRLADIVEETGHHNILRRFAVETHPLREDTGEDRNAQRVVINVTRKMIDLVQIVDRSAAARERQEIGLHHLVRLGNGDMSRFLRLLEDGLRRADNILILLDEEIAAREDRRRLFLQLVLILDVDDGDLQELETRDMCLRQLGVLGYDNNTFGIHDRPRKYHSILKIVYGNCTQCKPSLGLPGQLRSM